MYVECMAEIVKSTMSDRSKVTAVDEILVQMIATNEGDFNIDIPEVSVVFLSHLEFQIFRPTLSFANFPQ